MTKKVFDAVAKSLAASWGRRPSVYNPAAQDKLFNEAFNEAWEAGFRNSVRAVAIAFEDGAPRFDTEKFYRAVFGTD
jgi:hypothetical protein